MENYYCYYYFAAQFGKQKTTEYEPNEKRHFRKNVGKRSHSDE
jgi:hypothetical protein